MPLPLILIGGAAVIGALYGAKKGVDAKRDFDDAKEINAVAQYTQDCAKESLQERKDEAQKQLEGLGRQKVRSFEEGLHPFVNIFKKIKNVDFADPDISIEEIPLEEDLNNIEETTADIAEVVIGGGQALGSGALAGMAVYGSVGVLGTASTGTAIAGLSGAAATNATLAWLGGGSLAAGGLGMTAGAAVLGGIVAAPVLLIGGFVLANQAEKAKENARSSLAEAEAAKEAMETAEIATRAIGRMANDVGDTLNRVLTVFQPHIVSLRSLVVEDGHRDYRRYSPDEKNLVCRTASLAKTTRNLIDTPLFDDDGVLTQAIRRELKKVKEFLNQLKTI